MNHRALFALVVLLGGIHIVKALPSLDIVSTDSLQKPAGIDLSCCFRYTFVDNPTYADVNVIDTSWHMADATSDKEGMIVASEEEWNGIAWFRARFRVSEKSRMKSLAVRMFLIGACDVFLDGKKIHSFGDVSNASLESAVPMNQIFPLDPQIDRADTSTVHLLAFRVRTISYPYSMNDGVAIAFNAQLGRTQEMFSSAIDLGIKWMRLLFIPLGIVIALGVLHLLLFLFDRRSKVNLLYVVFTTIFVGIFLCWHVQGTSTNASLMQTSFWLINILWTVIVAVLVLLISMLYYGRVSARRLIITAAAVAIVVGLPFVFTGIGTILWGSFATIAAIDVTRMTFVAMKRRQEGAWIMGLGKLVFSVYILSWFFGFYLGLVSIPEAVWRPIFVLGLVSMPLSMSVFLARRVTKTNNDLTEQLRRVDELTTQKLQQERKALEEDVKRQHLEEENQRKSRELEEARKLQFSMLPTSMPTTDHIQSAMAMNTATEVGGDYIDYYVHADRHITFAIGDATGHGLKAGVMVATTKSHFQTNAISGSHADILSHTGDGIRKLHLRGLYMCLGLLTIKDYEATWTAAGIPPLLHLSAATGIVTQHLVKGLPLGAPRNGHTTTEAFTVAPGDALLLITDGLPELFNTSKQSLGYEEIEATLVANKDKSAHDVVDALIALAERWRTTQPYNDDVTVLVVKII